MSRVKSANHTGRVGAASRGSTILDISRSLRDSKQPRASTRHLAGWHGSRCTSGFARARGSESHGQAVLAHGTLVTPDRARRFRRVLPVRNVKSALVMVRVADKGDLYVHQGERAYTKWDHSPSRDCQGAVPPWARAACSRARLGKSPHAGTGPQEVSTMRTTGGANWMILGLILDTPRWSGSEGAAPMSQRDRRASPAAARQGRASLGGSVVERYVYRQNQEIGGNQ